MNKKTININLVQYLWLAHNQERIDQVLLLSNKYLWKQLDHKKKIFKNESIEDMKWCVRHDGSWRKIKQGLDHDEPCIGEEQADVLTLLYRIWWRITSEWLIWEINLAMKNHLSLSVNLYLIKYKVTWRSKVDIEHTVWSFPSHNL
jgi:hypothetical protein